MKDAVDPPPEVQLTLIAVAEVAEAPGLVGAGGTAAGCLLMVTPEARSGVALPFREQTLKLYGVPPVSPATAFDVVAEVVVEPLVQSAGAVAPL